MESDVTDNEEFSEGFLSNSQSESDKDTESSEETPPNNLHSQAISPCEEKSCPSVSPILSCFKNDGKPKLRFYLFPTFSLGFSVTAFAIANKGTLAFLLKTVLIAAKLTLFGSSFLCPAVGAGFFILTLIAWGIIYAKRNNITISSLIKSKSKQKIEGLVEEINYFSEEKPKKRNF